MSDHISTKIPSERLDPPGLSGELFVVPQFGNKNVGTDEERMSDQSSRKFVIQASLGKHAQQPDGISVSVPEGSGESFIKAQPGAFVTKLSSPEGVIYIYQNSDHELARANFECLAANAGKQEPSF